MKKQKIFKQFIVLLLSLSMLISNMYGIRFDMFNVFAADITITADQIVNVSRTYELTDSNGKYIGVKYTITLETDANGKPILAESGLYDSRYIGKLIFHYDKDVDEKTLNNVFENHKKAGIWSNWYSPDGTKICINAIKFTAAEGVEYIVPNNMCTGWSSLGAVPSVWSLLLIEFQEGLTIIGQGAFNNCRRLGHISSFEYEEETLDFTIIDNELYFEGIENGCNAIFPSSLTELKGGAFSDSFGNFDTAIFPASDNALSIRYSAFNAKSSCSLYFYNKNTFIYTKSNIKNVIFYGYNVENTEIIDNQEYVTPYLFSQVTGRNIRFIDLASLNTEDTSTNFYGNTDIYVDEVKTIRYSPHDDSVETNYYDSSYTNNQEIELGKINWQIADVDGNTVAAIENITELPLNDGIGTYIDAFQIDVKGIAPGIAILEGYIDGKLYASCEINVKEKDSPIKDSILLNLFTAFNYIVESIGEFEFSLLGLYLKCIDTKELDNGNTLNVWSLGFDLSSIDKFTKTDEYLSLLTAYNDFIGHPEINSTTEVAGPNLEQTQYLLRTLNNQSEKHSIMRYRDKSDANMNVSGLYYSTTNKNGEIIDSGGGIMLNPSTSLSSAYYYPTSIGPIYLRLESGLEGDLRIPLHLDDKGLHLKDDYFFEAIPYFMPEFGYGVDGATSVSAFGKLSAPINTKNDDVTIELEGELGVHIQVFFLLDHRQTLWKWPSRLQIYPELGYVNQISDTSTSPVEYNFINTETLSNAETNWNVENTDRLANNEYEKQNVLLDNVLGSSLPMQAEIEGKQVMVFQSYNPNNNGVINSCSLMYSVKEEGSDTWSTPYHVWNTGTSDYFADMKVVNNKLVLTYMKSIPVNELTDEFSITEMARSSEIFVTVFDPDKNTFNVPTQVTYNHSLDMMPQITNSNNKISVSWIHNDSNSLTLSEGTNTIHYAEYDCETNSISKERKILHSNGIIKDYTTFYDNNRVRAIYSGIKEDTMAVYDTDGHSLNALSELVHNVNEQSVISNMHYVDGSIEFISSGNVYRYNVSDGSTQMVNSIDSSVGANSQYVSNGTTNAYVWSSYNNETEKNEIVASIETTQGYSERITLYESETDICRYMSPILDKDGNWNIVANMETPEGTHKLVSISKKGITKIDVVGISVDELNRNEASQVPISVDVENIGASTLEKYYVSAEINGKKETKEVTTNLEVNGTNSSTLYFDLGYVTEPTPVSISIYSNESDIQSFTYTLGTTDISVESKITENIYEDTTTINAIVKNNGSISSEVKLELIDVNSSTSALKTETITINANETKEISYTIPNNEFSFTTSSQAHCKLHVISSITDTNTENNTSLFSVVNRDVVIDGFQINPSYGVRTVYSTNYKEEDVLEVGLIYGIAVIDDIAPEDMIIDSPSRYVYAYKGTEVGKTSTLYTKLSEGRSHIMTMSFGNTNVAAYSAEYCVRAYVKLADGSYVYSNIETYSAYELAKKIYESGKTSNKNNFELLYNIISTVDPTYTELDFDWTNAVLTTPDSETSGNLEITGYSISTTVQVNDSVPGGVRMYYSTKYTDEEINRIGLILTNIPNPNEEDMIINSSNSNVIVSTATSLGKSPICCSSWGYGQTYVMTMLFESYTTQLMTDELSIRAFVELADGTVEYSDVSTFTINDVATYLYDNSMSSREAYHNFLYERILTLVNPEYTKVEFDWSKLLEK